jgi:sestrin
LKFPAEIPSRLQNADLLRSHIRRIVRIHASCPLRDWTAACERVIAHARSTQIPVPLLRPISRFFELDAVLSPFTEREGGQVRALFREQFLGSGRLSYLDRVMSFRPDYATVFHTCQVVIMRDPGPLPVVWRHFVALIAAARHRSAYLCELETEQFLLSGGDKLWLDGIAACPTKLQSYAALDAIVAHQPWLLTAAHVAPLLRGNDAWTIGEIVHAMVISATFRALAGIVAGCGINNEVDFVNVNGEAVGAAAAAPAAVAATATAATAASSANVAATAAPTTSAPGDSAAHATELVIKRLQQIELTESSGLGNDDDDNNGGGDGGNGGAEIVEQFDRAGQEDDVPRRMSAATPPTVFPLASVGGTFFAMAAAAQTPVQAAQSAPASTASSASGVPALLRTVSAASATDATSARLQLTEAQERETAHLLKFIGPNTLRHAEFNVHSDHYKVFRVNDWSWPHQGYELLLRFLPRVAQPLDNLFELTQTMTDNCFNTFDNLDTGPYRRAAWQYVQRIKGVLHDDYDYQEINLLLNKYNKEFVKKVVCYPEFITAHDYQQLGYVLAPNEKMHLCALVVESRKQAELLYALHAVMSTMNPTHHAASTQ